MQIPGSKYVANRVLIISALTDGVSSICNVPDNQDIRILEEALTGVGISIKKYPARGRLEIAGILSPDSNLNKLKQIDVGESGTLLRFALGFACLLHGETSITAAERNRERPVEPLIKALGNLGADISVAPGESIYPIRVKKGLTGGTTVVSGQVSSQFISSLLIVSPYSMADVEIKVLKPIVSSGYIDLTIREMERFGVTADRITGDEFDLFRIRAGQRYQPREVNIPKDWSVANSMLAASVLLGKEIRINKIDVLSNPGESEFVFILQRMGCRVSIDPGSISVQRSGILKGIEVDMKDSPDSVLTLIPIALFAEGTTVIKNIGHLIYKESDRIKQAEKELRKIGADIRTTLDSMIIVGGKQLHPATTECHNDHRLAMCLGLIQLKNRDMKIVNRKCVQKSFPLFWDCMKSIDEGGEKCLEIQ